MISPTNINNGWSNWGNNVQTWLAGKCRIYRGFSQRSQLLLFRDFPASHVWLSHYICIHIYIYGWWFQPLWKILASWDYYSQYMENKKCSKPPTRTMFPTCQTFNISHEVSSLIHGYDDLSAVPMRKISPCQTSVESFYHLQEPPLNVMLKIPHGFKKSS